ncbi:MAG TPA: HAD family hydrolase [Lachnospiraceae bacterium]|nr:HAD family hydrolase [Lachnospiraceae bacterium]
MLENIDAVIFDLDGSLVDSMWIWRQIDIEYLGKFGIELPENLQSEIEGMSFGETAAYFKNRFRLPDSIQQIKDDWNAMAWDKYTHEVPLKEGVDSFLELCAERGIALGIATSNSRELAENIISVHGLENYFTCIMTGCDVGKGKPAPDIYLAVARKLQVEPGRCLVFEDIIPGILAGKAAGMKVCAVEDDYSIVQKEDKIAAADYYIEDFIHLPDICKRKKIS